MPFFGPKDCLVAKIELQRVNKSRRTVKVGHCNYFGIVFVLSNNLHPKRTSILTEKIEFYALLQIKKNSFGDVIIFIYLCSRMLNIKMDIVK
jgi:hypothetical protein